MNEISSSNPSYCIRLLSKSIAVPQHPREMKIGFMTIKTGLPSLSLLLKASTTQLLYKLFDEIKYILSPTNSPDRSVADHFIYTKKVGGSKSSWDIDNSTFDHWSATPYTVAMESLSFFMRASVLLMFDQNLTQREWQWWIISNWVSSHGQIWLQDHSPNCQDFDNCCWHWRCGQCIRVTVSTKHKRAIFHRQNSQSIEATLYCFILFFVNVSVHVLATCYHLKHDICHCHSILYYLKCLQIVISCTACTLAKSIHFVSCLLCSS